MIDIFATPFTDEAARRALVAIVVLSFGSAPIGVFLMLRRMSLTGDAMSHAILPGVAVAFLLSGMNRIMMTIGGLIAGLLVAVLSGLMTRVTEMKEDASLAVFYLVSLALGVTLVTSHGSSHELIEILFGDVQTIDAGALYLIAFNTTLTLCALAVIYRPLVMECVDPLFLRVAGRAGAMAHLVFMAFVVVNLVSAYNALGTLLAVGMMILPAGTARFWSRDISRIILVAIVSAILSCCGANPGMVSFFVKQALMNVAADLKLNAPKPKSRAEWADLMRQAGIKGIHIAERDTQRSKNPKEPEVFVNTWSVEGFISEGVQPSELGWGTHEKWIPENAHTHEAGCGAAIYLMQPGADTRVRTWCPTRGAQYGFLVTHNESISISDYFTAFDSSGTAIYRPTCHYAYHPADDAVLSLHEMFGRAARAQEKHHILDENEIADGIDELGVLLYGHDKNAYWYGSQLSIEETRKLAPYQNATGLQVTSALVAGMVWALENPNQGIVETDEMDFDRLLEIQKPYLGPVKGYYTDWTPLTDRPGLFPEDIDTSDPWQFKNVLVR